MPKVSVIIPCFNQAEFIEDAVNSTLNQTYGDIEIIIINDASKDNSYETIQELIKGKENIKFINLEQNKGVSHARNIGIEQSQGEYILPLDGDDKIEKTYIEKAVTLMENNPKIGFVYCDAEYFGTKKGKWILPEFNKDTFIFSNCILNSALYRKADWEKAGRYNEDMVAYEDYNLWLSFVEMGLTPYKIPEVLFYYRQHNSASLVNSCHKFNYELWGKLLRNHPKLYFYNKETLTRIFNPEETDIFRRIKKKLKKYKKLFNLLLILCIAESAIIIFCAVYMIFNFALN